jgi:beta-glucosidase/6-phospho-beta-glucosidase/beta-galactosidase
MAIFQSFFMGGFESACHRRRDGLQIDVQAATHHDTHGAGDYALMQAAGMRVARDALRWHVIESSPHQYDWSSFLPLLHAARDAKMQVIWDLCHWGLPHDIDIFSEEFVTRFARFAGATAEVVRGETDAVPFYSMINEISFWSWIGGDCETFYPWKTGLGPDLKRQLVRAVIAGMDAVRKIEPRARFVQAEPIIHIAPNKHFPEDDTAVASYVLSQFEVWDMLLGQLAPELGGAPKYLDIIGVNYYWNNQWEHLGNRLALGTELHKPLSDMLADVHVRYRLPMLISETGAEGIGGNSWMRYVVGEVVEAIRTGTPVEGICLYPVMDYPGWDDDRHCKCGLIAISEDWTTRSTRPEVVGTLARELERIQPLTQKATWSI